MGLNDPITDPSTNNRSVRNMLVQRGLIVPRVVRTGGSGRPQYGRRSASLPPVLQVAVGIGVTTNASNVDAVATLPKTPTAGHLLVAVVNLIDGQQTASGFVYPPPGVDPPYNVGVLGSVKTGAGVAYTQAGGATYARYTDSDGVDDVFMTPKGPYSASSLSIWYRVSDGSVNDKRCVVHTPNRPGGFNPDSEADLALFEFPAGGVSPLDAVGSVADHTGNHSSLTLDGGTVAVASSGELVVTGYAERYISLGTVPNASQGAWPMGIGTCLADGTGNEYFIVGAMSVVLYRGVAAGSFAPSNAIFQSVPAFHGVPYAGLSVAFKQV